MQIKQSLNMMIPTCFSHPNTPSSTSPHHHQFPQNLTTCIYQAQLFNSPTHLTLTWSKTLFSHSLTIYSSEYSFSITIPLYPSTFSLFRTRRGSKSISLTRHNHQRIKLYWDFTWAQFIRNSAEPDSSFYFAISCNAQLEFFLGDLHSELSRRSGLAVARQLAEPPTLMSRREHVFGRNSYVSMAEFMGSKHLIGIECDGGSLVVKVDGQTSLVVKRLAWKFRGNERIFVNGVEVDFFWDVFSWVDDNNGVNGGSGGNGHGVFIFQVGDGGVWPEMGGPEKRLMRKSLPAVGPTSVPAISLSPSPSCSSVLQWAEESSDCGRSSTSSSTRSCGSNSGFSLLLYAWRKD